MIEIVTIDTPSLGDRTYLATDGASAMVIEPQRNIDRVLALAAARGVAVTHVFETNIHNDYGFGSFCAATTPGAGAAGSTIGDEKRSNPALPPGRGSFVAALVADLDAYPAYYAHTAAANVAGPDAPDPGPPARVGRAGLVQRIAAAQRDLARIGIDRLAGAALTSPGGWPASPRLAIYPVSGYRGLAAARNRQNVAVLDVRRAPERARGHLAGSLHVPLHELPDRLRELPARPLWVHCQGGYRASIAASPLQAAGHTVTAIDDDFGRAAATGLTTAGARRLPAA